MNAGTAGAYNITEPIKWRKLSQSGTEALYVADQILDNVSYHNSYASITWAGSSIHSWLNNTTATGFIGKAFTTNQLNDTTGIVKEKIITTDGSVNTNDKAFLLSKDEAQNSFASPNSRKASGTTYAKTHLNDGTALAVNGGYSYWWCRSPGIDNGSAAGVYYDGYVNSNGAGVGDRDRGARPAFYLNLASPLFKDSNNGVTWDLLPGTSWKTGSNMWSQMDTYQGGQKLPTVENIADTAAPVPFRGWQINHTKVIYTEIPIDQTGDIVLTPVFAPQVNYYENKDDLVATISYARRESGDGSIKATPGEAKAGWEAPRGYEFDAWYAIPSDTRITDLNIPAGNYDDINVYPRYKLINYPITWTLGDGIFINPSIASPSYTYGTEWPLPVAHDLYIPRGREFDHWEIKQNGVVIDNNAIVIPATYEGAIEIIAKYKNLSYNITWDLGTAPDDGSWVDPSVASASYTYGTNWPLPDKSKVNGPTGREFDYWTIKQTGKADITHATVISSTTYDDVTIVATYKNSSYKITWDLGTAPDDGSWVDPSVASASYTYGTNWPLPDKTKINGPTGRELNYWTIKQTGKADVTQATEISATTYGDVTIVATYKNLSYKITWVMNGATLKTGALAEDYTYGTGLILPASTSITMPAGQEFAYWTVNGVETDRISTTQIDPVTVTLINTEMASKTHKITWDYAKGKADEWSFVGFTAPETFVEEIALTLPDASKVKPKNVNRELDYWTVNGVKATEIAATTKVDVTIAAVLKDKGGEDKDVDSISIVTNPKTSYSEGSKFDPSGLVIKANYTDGSTANITYSKANANEFSFNPTLTTSLTVDMKTVEIGYKGKTTTLNITVKKNSPAPTPPGDGGGGTGGGGGAGPLATGGVGVNNIEIAINTPIILNEYVWTSTKDETSGKIFYGIKILKTTALAKIFMSNTTYGKFYKDLDENYIQLKNGIFNLQYLNQFFNYAFDYNGNMLTGIVVAKDGTKLFAIDAATTTLVDSGSINGNKYLFYDGAGELYGIMWNQPITYNNVEYTFDSTGKIISEKALTANTTNIAQASVDSWEYDPANNTWKFYTVDASGHKTYLKNTAKEINVNGTSLWYIFDENGNMKTGLTEYNGKTYYLVEIGENRGAMYVGTITLNGKTYNFNAAGELIA